MAVKQGLWSLTLLPGESYPFLVRHDLHITNAALGEELRSQDGRSVIKVTYSPQIMFDSDSEDDDSDYSFDPELEEEMADEFELDSDEEGNEEEEKPKANGVKKAKKAEAEAEEEEDDEEVDEDMDDEDEEDDSEFDSDDEEEETAVLCSLIAGKVEQASLDLTFEEGTPVMFEVTGENAVHLLGNYIDQYPGYDSDSDFDDEHDDYSELYGSDEEDEIEFGGEDDEEEEEDEEVPNGKIELIEEPKKKATPKAKAEQLPTPAPSESKASKRKAEELESPAEKKPATEGLSKNQLKKQAKKAKLEAQKAEPAKEVKKEQKGNQKKTLPSGLVIEDVKVGDGPVAKSGKRLGMRYIGKLENGKQFDANTSGKPFNFVLGRGEVIAGWDQGLVGMAVGGERRLTIPAALAYGKQALPGIPKNSTLKFEVKLVSVN